MKACQTVQEVIAHTIQVQARGLAAPMNTLTKEFIRAQMRRDCESLGLRDLDRDIPPVVHVAGTKGKGSTCALVESILRQGKLRTGLFTSPHLVDIRERIRLNGKLLPRQEFDDHVMTTYKLLGVERMETIGFFQFLTLAMFRIFALKRHEVDVLILETGIGGRLDFTNCVDSPVCCAITRLDFDHVSLLGNTLELIAGEKAGIAKSKTRLFTLASQPALLPVIQHCCDQVGAVMETVEPLDASKFDIGIKGGAHQLENAALASAMARVVFAKLNPRLLERQDAMNETIAVGLATCRFPGRAQVEKMLSNQVTCYLDGAHTPISVECAAKWFQSTAMDQGTTPKKKRALVFHCSADRNPKHLLEIIRHECTFDYVFMVPPTSGPRSPAGYHDQLVQYWNELNSTKATVVETCSPLALKQRLSDLPEITQVLVVGSFFLVGDALQFWVEDWNVEQAFV
ncbi:hypothetical protein BASA81_000880 [Batrachochytrium salamandrivorans]|nr:hypothetical protein BASA81_000880 [Batrachochytrium salamandrivorans]